MQRIKKSYCLAVILVIILVLTMGCMKEEPSEEPKNDDEQKQEQATYVGSEKCSSCHTEINEQVALNSHGTAFKSLESYNLEFDENVKVYEEVKDGKPKDYSLSDVKVAGVMSDHYVVGSIGEKFYRVAAVESEEGKWSLKPASFTDVNKDGTEDWVIKDYTCGDCHSPGLATNLKNKIDLEPGFGCESCHGPGSIHVTTSAKEAINNGQDACVDCHSSSEPSVEGDILIAQNHYGTRSWFDSNHNKGDDADCLNCHTAHKINADGQMIIKDSAQEVCSSCHGDGMDVEEIMWVNPSDARDHFTKDHSFKKYPYEVYDDDPGTKPVEIRNPDTIESMKKKMTK